MGTTEASQLYAGVDVGKAHHWVCVLDEQGRVILSRKVANDETDLTRSYRRSPPPGWP